MNLQRKENTFSYHIRINSYLLLYLELYLIFTIVIKNCSKAVIYYRNSGELFDIFNLYLIIKSFHFSEFAISFSVSLIMELSNKIDFFYLIESLGNRWLLHVFPISSNSYLSSFSWKMFSYLICFTLIIIMSTNLFRS